MKLLIKWLVATFLSALAIVSSSQAQNPITNATAGTASLPAGIHPLKASGIENFYQLTDKIYSGSAPEGDAAFADLQARGVKTIITVDGAKPDVEAARRHGIRYVHLPFGYDGVPTNQAVRLIKAAETLPGPIYVHCHHGSHRGPAGAAVICMGMVGWTPAQADSWLKLAGTSTNYPGLYRTVEAFQPPSAQALKMVPEDFPETSPIPPLADVMVQIDQTVDRLKLMKQAGYHAPASNPDVDPAHEALLLDELFKELARSPIAEKRDDDFRSKLARAEQAAGEFHTSLSVTPVITLKADVAFQHLNDACAACHKAHRN
jgi:protein tyrosine phosphatase (PTP) superfamily phosphohydrolase (DUF442 family)